MEKTDMHAAETEKAIKKSLKELRAEAHLTQKELSCRTGIKLSTIQAFERGKRPIQGDVFRYLLARELHCRVNELPDD